MINVMISNRGRRLGLVCTVGGVCRKTPSSRGWNRPVLLLGSVTASCGVASLPDKRLANAFNRGSSSRPFAYFLLVVSDASLP